jgi:hypothetical protein
MEAIAAGCHPRDLQPPPQIIFGLLTNWVLPSAQWGLAVADNGTANATSNGPSTA